MNEHTPTASPAHPPVAHAKGLGKQYLQGDSRLEVLIDINLAVAAGERVVVLGRSGSGKSTLLHLLGGLMAPSSGEVWVHGHCMSRLSANESAAVRRRSMGFVYQFHHLLPEFSALENVMMPLRLGGCGLAECRVRAETALQEVNLHERRTHRPAALSGGERQRVAIARALVTRPKLLLADEPTGNLDRENAQEIFALLNRLISETGAACVLATHDALLTRDATRVVRLECGRMIDV